MSQTTESYEKTARVELQIWQEKMRRKPSFGGRVSKRIQNRINKMIPEKVHQVITTAIRETVKVMMSGGGLINPPPLTNVSLEEREIKVRERIEFYKNTAYDKRLLQLFQDYQ